MTSSKTLQDLVADYIAEKRALGYKYDKPGLTLNRFAKLAEQKDYTQPQLCRELVEMWCEKTAYESESNHQCRIGIVRGLAQYMDRLGFPAYIYMKKGTVSHERSFKPYIFSNTELAKIFSATDEVLNTKSYPFRSEQIKLILKTLYSTGMRSSELRNLKKDDVDLVYGILHIYGTKFNKERFIPLDEVLLQQLRTYSQQMCCYEVWKDAQYFFVNSFGRQHKDVYHPYREVLNLAGISHGGRGKGPRIHDFRHTFAVHCLRNWVRAGKDLTVALPYLSSYMGHTGIRSSQYYLRLTAELYPDIVETLDSVYGWMIPEVSPYDFD
ncbi:tyrosine-type recombinase/integrase [Proteiniclasticum sp. BAD-10]|uniref:Tyrosine-type recombinase/integrase n=1 Tax=Proteiniclasticum sediminis TaxID=2804028 RepID=A0A941CU56_9CLOT|nr:tyrosine-type recombinase/integrase [Proteiniclasticum sediminis]MBR0577461.1 tyrosine-type recombinase/integrase [Proteiniclasticum sediminis]